MTTCTNVIQHDIVVGDHEPIKQHPYHVSPLKWVAMQKEVEYLPKNGLVVPSTS